MGATPIIETSLDRPAQAPEQSDKPSTLTGKARSLANLRPAKKGEVRNPTGRTGKPKPTSREEKLIAALVHAATIGDGQGVIAVLKAMLVHRIGENEIPADLAVAIRVVDPDYRLFDLEPVTMEGSLDIARDGFVIMCSRDESEDSDI